MTTQIDEFVIINGNKGWMSSHPLIPKEHPRIYERSPQEVPSGFRTTACRRGYLGTWEIRDDRIYLVRLSGRLQLRGCTPVFADWVSEVLRVPMGEVLYELHGGPGAIHEKDLHIKVKNGVVVSFRTIKNRKPIGDLQFLFGVCLTAILVLGSTAAWLYWLFW